MRKSKKEQEEYIERLKANKPRRENYSSEEEFDEAYFSWMSKQGRIIAIWQKKNLDPRAVVEADDVLRCKGCGVELFDANKAPDFPGTVCLDPSCVASQILEAKLLY